MNFNELIIINIGCKAIIAVGHGICFCSSCAFCLDFGCFRCFGDCFGFLGIVVCLAVDSEVCFDFDFVDSGACFDYYFVGVEVYFVVVEAGLALAVEHFVACFGFGWVCFDCFAEAYSGFDYSVVAYSDSVVVAFLDWLVVFQRMLHYFL